MGKHVSLEDTSCCARVVALCATERLVSTMNKHVSFQMISFGACVAALAASVGLFSIMLKHVLFEVLCHLEREIAVNT